MRVAITHPYSWPEVRRGAERIIVETGRALAGRGHDVTVLTAGDTAGTRHDDGVTTVRYRRRFARAGLHERWFGWRVAPQLVRGRYDVVHSFMPHDAVAAVRTQRFTGHRTLYDEMGIPGHTWAKRRDGPARERVAREVDVYGCMSHHALRALREHTGRAGVLIPGGTNLAEFTPAEQREPRPTLLFSGAFDLAWKGVAGLLEALALLAEDEPDVRLWLSGPGEGTRLLAAAPPAAAERTEILPLGEPGDQAERYRRAWATVLPSRNESFGMVLLESLASGTPIVTTDHAAPQELVGPDTGGVARLDDAASLADALARALRLARDPATAQRCRAAAAAYDWSTGIAPLLERLYAGDGRDAAAEPTTTPGADEAAG